MNFFRKLTEAERDSYDPPGMLSDGARIMVNIGDEFIWSTIVDPGSKIVPPMLVFLYDIEADRLYFCP